MLKQKKGTRSATTNFGKEEVLYITMVTLGQLARLWLGFILDPHDSQWLYGPYRRVMGPKEPFKG